jgi:multiple sugar transport system permease protein
MITGLKWQRRIKVVAGSLWMTFILISVLFPTYWTALASIKDPKDLMVRVPKFWTSTPTLNSYRGLLTQPFLQFERLTINSLTVALGATLMSVVMAVFAGLALARLRFPGRQRLGMAVFFTYLVPPVLLFIPLYVLMATLNLHDSKLGLILVYSSFTVPFGVWMLRGYFHTIPVELEECAMIDGCTRVGAWIRIVLPLASPGIAASAIFAFTLAWNEFLYAYVLTETANAQTMPIGLASFIQLDVYRWGELSAGALVMAIPAVVLYFLGQRFVVAGLTGGAVKG